MRIGIIWLSFCDLVKGGDGSYGISFSLQRETELGLGFGEVGAKFDGGHPLLNRAVAIALLCTDVGEIEMRLGIFRGELDSAF